MRCNERIKFAALLDRAVALGFDAVATGHYAVVRTDEHGRRELHRASDEAKDQSYVLGVLTAEQLAHAVFPLGETPSKAVVRAEAAERGFRVAAKPDSHDICFIPDGDTRGWLADRLGSATGPVIDRDGTELGTHEGALAYTVGQRRGLSLSRPAPDGRPRFVLEVKPATNTVVVGPREALAVGALAGARMSWAGPRPSAREFRCDVQVRAHAEPVAATASFEDGELVVRPDEPIIGLAPGQSAVLYDGTRVLGQITVDRTVSAAPVA
jgi:tRNA-uridine 2-sulfurtransferase